MTITAKYDGICRTCGTALPAGSEIDWSRETGARCLDCSAADRAAKDAARAEAEAAKKEAAKVARAARKSERDEYEIRFRETGEFRTARIATSGNRTLFESDVCGRCGGSGRMPFSVYHGLCFDCHGEGVRLTKRGAEAAEFYRESLLKRATEIRVGDRLLQPGIPPAGSFAGHAATWFTVEEIGETGAKVGHEDPATGETLWVEHLGFRGHNDRGESCVVSVGETFEGQSVRFAWSAEEKAEKKAAALAYQRTLGPNGKPRRR